MSNFSELKAGVEPWTMEFGDESGFSRFHHYTFQWIDDYSHFLGADDELISWSLSAPFLLHFRKRFAADGWSGEGKIGLLWLPPFSGDGAPSSGFFILHAKRKHDGMSWIASRYSLHGLEGRVYQSAAGNAATRRA